MELSDTTLSPLYYCCTTSLPLPHPHSKGKKFNIVKFDSQIWHFATILTANRDRVDFDGDRFKLKLRILAEDEVSMIGIKFPLQTQRKIFTCVFLIWFRADCCMTFVLHIKCLLNYSNCVYPKKWTDQ